MKRRIISSVLALVMLLSLMIVPSISVNAADAAITVDGDVSEWTGWVTVSAADNVATNGTVQNTTPYKLNRSYQYAIKVIDDTLYVAVKQPQAAVASPEGEAVAQTNCTNVRLWIDNDMSTAARSALFDFGFDGTKVVESRANNDGTNKIESTAAGKSGEDGYAVEIAIKASDLGLGKVFGYALTVSAPDYAIGGFKGSFDNKGEVFKLPTSVLEPNTEYTITATASFANVDKAGGSAFVNFYYGETWGDIFAVTADAAEATAPGLKFTTGAEIPADIRFDTTIGTWGNAKADISVKNVKILKGEEVVYTETFGTIPEGYENLKGEYAALHSIVYAAGAEPWTTTANYTLYSDVKVTAKVAEGSKFIYDENKLAYLADGKAAADATAFNDPRYVSFQNDGFKHGVDDPVDGTIELIADLGTVKAVAGAYLNLFIDTNSMIGKPTAVHFYGSLDGENWYHISAGGNAKVDGGAEKTESIYMTETTDGIQKLNGKATNIKAIYNLQYVKAVVTIDYGWIFASEFGVFEIAEPAEGSVVNPEGPFAFKYHTTDNIGILTSEDVPEGGLDLSQAGTKTKQLIKAKATDIKGVYDITFNKVNPWVSASDNGHKGTMTLAEDEILIVISAKNGNLVQTDGSIDIKSAAKWTARGLTYDADDDGVGSGDFVYLDGENLYLYPATKSTPVYTAPAARVGELISVGKEYTTSPLHRQGGKEVGWAYDENAPVSYPDEDGKSLTDGISVPQDKQDFSAPEFAGFNYGTPNYKELGYSWINLDLGEVTDISKIVLTFGSSKLGSGIGANNLTVRFYVSEDGETWTYLGQQAAVDSTEEITVDVAVGTDIAGRYVKAEFSRAGWMFVTELAVYDVAPDPVTLYVNAINDVLNYSVAGKFNEKNTIAGTEGYAAIVSDPAKLATSYAWVNMAYFAPTDVDGVYKVVGIQQIAGEATAPLAFPEGGFVYIANTGNDWPALCKAYKEALEADPNTTMEKPWYYDQYKDTPNFQTPQVNGSFSAIAGLAEGMKAQLVNINLELSTITDNFESFIIVNDVTDMPYVDGALDYDAIDLEGKELVEIEVDGYDYINTPADSWADAGNALIDGNVPADVTGPGFAGATKYAIDFNFKEAADVYALEMWITQMDSWGIRVAADVQFYGTTDGENYFYLGAGYIPADAPDADENGVADDGNYAFKFELPTYAKGLTGIRVVLDKGVGGWVFASEFNAYTAQEAVSEPETSEPEVSEPETSEPATPPTGETTSIVLLALVLFVACGAVVVSRKRRA